MEVRQVDHVIIDDRDLAYAGSRECGDDAAANAPSADDCDARLLKSALAETADLRQHDVPRVAL
jgi:hypothetical protein